MKKGTVIVIPLCLLALSLISCAQYRKGSGGALAPSAGTPLACEGPRFIAAAIYGQGAESNKLLFRFKREARQSGAKLEVQRDYTRPDGKLAARERAVYKGSEPVFYEMQERQTGERGTAKILRNPLDPAKGNILFEYTKERGGKPKKRTEPLRENTLVSDMLGPFLASHWDGLAQGEKLTCRCIVVSRRETVGCTVVKKSEATWQGRSVAILKMEPSSLLVAALVDPLYLTIETAPPHRVLQYVGRITPKIQAGDKWKNTDAVTVFDWEPVR